jgi:hypothetical protein
MTTKAVTPSSGTFEPDGVETALTTFRRSESHKILFQNSQSRDCPNATRLPFCYFGIKPKLAHDPLNHQRMTFFQHHQNRWFKPG